MQNSCFFIANYLNIALLAFSTIKIIFDVKLHRLYDQTLNSNKNQIIVNLKNKSHDSMISSASGSETTETYRLALIIVTDFYWILNVHA